MGCRATRYACGIVAIHSDDATEREFVIEIARAAEEAGAGLATIFFSQDEVDPAVLADAMAELAPGLSYAGCSTAGEMTPDGYGEGNMIAMLFPSDQFEAAATMIEDISSPGIEKVATSVTQLRRKLAATAETGVDDQTFAVLLIDGLSRAEEAVTSALYWRLDDIPLVGGSAGDNLHFERTSLILNGKVRQDCAIIILVRSRVPFHIFKSENFNPTETKLVVTASDPDQRRVYEFNAEPAAHVYAAAIGTDPEALTPASFASHPVVLRIGGEYYCRSIQKLHPDGSLSFFCAIDDGIVLTLAQPKGMVESTREKLNEVETMLGGIDVVLGFDCVLRRLDAQNRQSFRAISELYRSRNVIGFGTYGEQYRSMHLNQTFTGIAFAAERRAAE
jgi:hypothetical protein